MPIQKVEYEFPDPDKIDAAAEIEVSTPEETSDIEVEGAVGREVMQKPKKEPTEVKVVEDENLEVEVVDDTPEADRGRKPSRPPEEITDDELENYSEKVKKRIQHFSKGYHDERRVKETALRQKEEGSIHWARGDLLTLGIPEVILGQAMGFFCRHIEKRIVHIKRLENPLLKKLLQCLAAQSFHQCT